MSGIDAFCEAAARSTRVQSNFVLDSLGISRIDVTTLPCYMLFRMACRYKYGVGWLGRLWCQWLRPYLAPERQLDVDEAFAYADTMRRSEFLNAVLERGDK